MVCCGESSRARLSHGQTGGFFVGARSDETMSEDGGDRQRQTGTHAHAHASIQDK